MTSATIPKAHDSAVESILFDLALKNFALEPEMSRTRRSDHQSSDKPAFLQSILGGEASIADGLDRSTGNGTRVVGAKRTSEGIHFRWLAGMVEKARAFAQENGNESHVLLTTNDRTERGISPIRSRESKVANTRRRDSAVFSPPRSARRYREFSSRRKRAFFPVCLPKTPNYF